MTITISIALAVTRWVNQTERISKHVGVAVERLGVGGAGDDGIGRQEAVNRGDVVTGVHVDQANAVVMLMTCKTSVGQFTGGWGAGITIAPIGQEVGGGHDHPRRRHHQGGTAQVVYQEVEQPIVARFRVAGCGWRWPARPGGRYCANGRKCPNRWQCGNTA